MKTLLLALAVVAFAPCAFAQEAPKQTGDLDLVFLGGKQPVLLRLHVLIDGKSVQAAWNEHVERWFRYLDVDNDGGLDADELRRAPTEGAWGQMMRTGAFFPNQGGVVNPAQFTAKAGDKVTLAELRAYYSRKGGPIQLIGQANNTGISSAVSNNLFKALDLDGDGKLSKAELLSAAKTLRKLDLDDDELISAQELAGIPNPGPGLGNFPVFGQRPVPNNNAAISDAFFHIRPGENRLPALLLSHYDHRNTQKLTRAQLGLDEATFARLDANHDGGLDLEELAQWHERPADVEFTVRLGQASSIKQHKAVQPAFASAVKEPAPGVYQTSLEDAQINLLTAPGFPLPAQLNQAQAYLQQFRFADSRKQGYVEMKDLVGGQFQFMRQVFVYLDRDGDGKLTEKEVQTFVDLQYRNTDGVVTVSLADQGRALFQLLDANRDGRLSQRELLGAWDRLAPLDKDKTGFITANDLARQFQLTVQRGLVNGAFQPGLIAFNPNMGGAAAQAVYAKDVPEWFRKMDKNGDGDVSFAEFLGSRAQFDAIDTDRDGLISQAEAIRYDAVMRAKKQ